MAIRASTEASRTADVGIELGVRPDLPNQARVEPGGSTTSPRATATIPSHTSRRSASFDRNPCTPA